VEALVVWLSAYWPLFLASFLAGSLVPFPSEAILLPWLHAGGNPCGLWFCATLGNSLGAFCNVLLGRFALRWQHQRWFYWSADQLARGEQLGKRYGYWGLLFTWLPLLGDLLALAAGLLRLSWWWVLLLIPLGKALRYAAVIWLGLPHW
jgi:membrane protein YqaA with SNARE-associated domain